MGKTKVTTTPPVIVVDADAIVAQAHPHDSNHAKAIQITQDLQSINARMIYPVTAVCEAVTVLQHKLSNTATAYGTAVVFTDPQLQVSEVNQQTIINATNNYFEPQGSKKNTLFDCIVLETAKTHKADAIFSFDKFYKRRGYKLAEDYVS